MAELGRDSLIRHERTQHTAAGTTDRRFSASPWLYLLCHIKSHDTSLTPVDALRPDSHRTCFCLDRSPYSILQHKLLVCKAQAEVPTTSN